jgi:hypothetical protein
MTAAGDNVGDGRSAARRRLRRRRAVRHRRRQSLAALAVLLIILGLLVAYRALIRPQRLQRLAREYLGEFFTTRVDVTAVSFSLIEGIQLFGVRVADPHAASGGHPLLAFDAMSLRHDPVALLLGKFQVDEIVASKPVIRARFNPQRARFNVQDVFRIPQDGERRTLRHLPDVRIQEAQVLIYADDDPAGEAVDEIDLSVTGRPAGTRAATYRVAWVARTDRRSTGHFAIDLRSGVLADGAGGAPWLALESASLVIEATQPRAKRWIDLLGVTGRFRIVDYAIGFRPSRKTAERLAIELDGASLSIPISAEEAELPPGDRFLRLDDVSGRIEVDSANATADVVGRLAGARCSLRGELHGEVGGEITFADVALTLDLAVEHLRLPRTGPEAPEREARIVQRWRRLRHFYRDFSPKGHVDITVGLVKDAGPQAGMRLREALVTGRGAEITVRHFPYPMYDVRGDVRITPDGIWLESVTARNGTAEVVADGWLSALKRTSAAQLCFTARRVTLDDALCDALKLRHRDTWQRFTPRGVADIDVVMTRPAGVDQPVPWEIAIEAELLSVDAAYQGFPYPLRDLHGTVRVRGDVFEVDDVRGRCGHGALRAEGYVQTGAKGAGAQGTGAQGAGAVSLRLQADALPLDATLHAALPSDARDEVRRLRARGDVGIDVLLVADPHAEDAQTGATRGRLRYDIIAEADGVTARPDALPIEVQAIRGRVRATPDEVTLDGLNGRACGGTVTLAGRLARSSSGHTELQVRGENVQVTDALRAALPESARARLAPWQIDGPLDITGRLGGDDAFALRCAPTGATVRHRDLPLPWQMTAGAIQVEPDGVTLSDIQATAGDARLRLDGSLTAAGGTLRGDLRGFVFSQEWREVMPWKLRRAWNNLEPTGAIDARNVMLAWHSTGSGHPLSWRVRGDLELFDAGLWAGVRLADLNGKLSLSGEAPRGLAGAALAGDIALTRMSLAGHAVTDVSARWLRDGINRRARIDQIRGTAHGGTLTGEVDWETQNRETRYSLAATLQRAELGSVIAARSASGGRPVADMPGVVDGRFYLTGLAGDSASRKGGGKVSVRDAELYRLPPLLAILHVINLSVPEESAFQSAKADFTLVGDELQLQGIELLGTALALIGEGTMALSTQSLDLRLITVSPHRWAQVPVVSEMLEGMARELMEVEVTGTLEKPQATAKPLRNVEAALNALLTMEPANPPTPQEPRRE